MERRLAAAVLVLSAMLAGCASASADDPAWADRAATQADSGYPDLQDVPRAHQAETRIRHWREVSEELAQAREELLANPRAQYTPPEEDPAEFLEEAREALTDTRDSH